MSMDLQVSSIVPPPPPRPAEAHKGNFGTVIVVAGSPNMIGAPALCASAALRGGAGLVKIATQAAVLPASIIIEPGATGILLGERNRDDLAQLDAADPQHNAILAVGPGLGVSEWSGRLVAALLRGRRAIVLDADGLNVLAHRGDRRMHSDVPLVMTPHPGEFDRLARPLNITESPIQPETRPVAAARLALAHGAVVVLKGRHTVVTDGRRAYVNPTGNPALATAGTGDVLTGLIASLLAQHMPPFDAAVLGVYLHGLAADIWRHHHGPSGLTARDLANRLPDAFNHHRTKCEKPGESGESGGRGKKIEPRRHEGHEDERGSGGMTNDATEGTPPFE